MMQTAAEHITRVQDKLQELLKRYQQLQKECAQQQKLISILQEKELVSEKKIRTLSEQQHILKSASGTMGQADKKEFDVVINRYIREIDKCIDLLSE